MIMNNYACVCFTSLILFGAFSAVTASAEVIYQEKNGVVVGEGEIYSSREHFYYNGITNNWYAVPDENAGAGTIINARNGSFIQCLPDNNSGGHVNAAPEVSYKMQINTPGNYRLYLRRDGALTLDSNNQLTGGTSDSMFVDIVELKDGVIAPYIFGTESNLVADWYEVTGNVDGNFSTIPWYYKGGAETNTAGCAWHNCDWLVPTQGVYTLRFSQREDGAAIDAWVLQLSSLPAPVNDGPVMSLIEPPKTLSCVATDDTFLRRDEPTVPHGTNDVIIIKNDPVSYPSGVDRNIYLSFDISGIHALGNETVTNANLKIYLQNEGTSTNHEIYVAVISESATAEIFDEDVITSGNSDVWSATNENGVDFSKIYGGAPVGSFTVSSSNEPAYMEFSSRALVNAIRADANGVFSVVLYREFDNVNFDYFVSKENLTLPSPVLEISYGYEQGTIIMIQ